MSKSDRAKNLIPLTEQSPEVAAEIRRKGQAAQKAKQREQKSFRQAIREIMSMPLSELSPEARAYIESGGIPILKGKTLSEQFVYSVFLSGLIEGNEKKLDTVLKAIGDTASHDISKIQAKNDTDRVQIDRERLEAQKQTAQNQNDILAMWTESIIKSGTETEKPAKETTEEKQTETDDGRTEEKTEEPTE